MVAAQDVNAAAADLGSCLLPAPPTNIAPVTERELGRDRHPGGDPADSADARRWCADRLSRGARAASVVRRQPLRAQSRSRPWPRARPPWS